MLEEKVYEVRVMAVKMKLAVIKQLPTSYGISWDEREYFEAICHVKRQKIDERMGVAVLGLFHGTPIVVMLVDGYSVNPDHSINYAGKENIPFAVIS